MSPSSKHIFAPVIFAPSTAKTTTEHEKPLRETLLVEAVNISGDEHNAADTELGAVTKLDPSTMKHIKICCFNFGVLLFGFLTQILSLAACVLTTTLSHTGHADDNESTIAAAYVAHNPPSGTVFSSQFTLFAANCILIVFVYAFTMVVPPRYLFQIASKSNKSSCNQRESAVLEKINLYVKWYSSLGVVVPATIGFGSTVFAACVQSTFRDTLVTAPFLMHSFIFCYWIGSLVFTLKRDTTTTTRQSSSTETVFLV